MLNEERDPVTQQKAQSDQYYYYYFFKLPSCIQDIDNRHN
jgi:hypothetical protein